MPWPWLREGFLGCARVRRHLLVPYVASEPFRVLDENCNRRAERTTMANTAYQLDLVLFELLTRSTTKSQSTARQLIGYVGDGDRHVGRHSFDDDHQRLTVTLASGQVAQHAKQFYRWRCDSSRRAACRKSATSGSRPSHTSCCRAACAHSMSKPSTTRAPHSRAARSNGVSSG